jgi:hypothetical protein
MNRTSKINRLPETLREELNQRLRNGEPAHLLLPWLNALPEVLALVEEHYGGNLISPQNLSDWNLGGYREWLTRQEMRESSKDFATDAPHLTAAAGGSLLNPLTTAIHARYAALLVKMPLDGEAPQHIRTQLDDLLRLHQTLIQDRRNDLLAQKNAILAAEQERKRQKTNDELIEEFKTWAARPEVRAALFDEYEDDQERQRNFQLFLKKIRSHPDDITPAGQEPKKKPAYEEVEEDDDEEEEGDDGAAAADGGEFGVSKGTVPKVNSPVVRWDERPDGSLDEAAIRALHARTADDIRREVARSKATAGGNGLEEIKPE